LDLRLCKNVSRNSTLNLHFYSSSNVCLYPTSVKTTSVKLCVPESYSSVVISTLLRHSTCLFFRIWFWKTTYVLSLVMIAYQVHTNTGETSKIATVKQINSIPVTGIIVWRRRVSNTTISECLRCHLETDFLRWWRREMFGYETQWISQTQAVVKLHCKSA